MPKFTVELNRRTHMIEYFERTVEAPDRAAAIAEAMKQAAGPDSDWEPSHEAGEDAPYVVNATQVADG